MASIHTALPVSQFSTLAARPAKPLCYVPASRITCSAAGAVAEPKLVGAAEPLLLSAVRGDDVERPPVWLMRQAGRYMKSYQTLCEKHPSFRERSENVDLVVEISLQPWKVFKPDGVILFSDILTPLSGMNIPFDIVKGKGPIIFNPLRTAADVEQVVEFVPEEFVPYVGEALTILRKEVNNEAAVLGFVGAPFTLASYVVEGGSSKHFSKIKRLAFSEPKVLHALLQKFTTSLVRLHFHDCFDNGCDGSILLDDTSSFTGEKNAFPNANSARGFDVVDTIKAAVEMVCLGIVSCADLLAIAARDSVVSLGGPNWNVKLGRRDARTTSQAAAARSIPPPTSSLNSLILRFAIVGLSSRDMVALSGSHTFGQARCATFRDRIYNETTIDPTFAQERQQNCPRATGTGDNNLAPFVGRILVKRLIPADCMRVILSAVRQFLSRLRDVCDEA